MKFTSAPMRASPRISWNTPTRKVRVSTNWIYCGEPGSATCESAAYTAIEIAVVGPETRCQEEPKSAATTAGTIAA